MSQYLVIIQAIRKFNDFATIYIMCGKRSILILLLYYIIIMSSFKGMKLNKVSNWPIEDAFHWQTNVSGFGFFTFQR